MIHLKCYNSHNTDTREAKTKIIAKTFSYNESISGSINGVAPKGSMFASNILLIMELPAIEAASPALKPEQKIHKASHVKEKQRKNQSVHA